MAGLYKMTSSFHLRLLSSFQQIYLRFVVVKDDVEVDLSVRLQAKFVVSYCHKSNEDKCENKQ